jgi:hypothetical protein
MGKDGAMSYPYPFYLSVLLGDKNSSISLSDLANSIALLSCKQQISIFGD